MYLDPGFGGMLIQVIVAIVAAGGIILFSLRRKIRALFSKNKDVIASDATVKADDVGVSGDVGVTEGVGVNEGDDDDVVDMLSDEKADTGASDD